MELITDLAITLKAIPYQERNRIVTGITENHGKITVMAKNAVQSRRFGGTLDLFTASEWHYSEKPAADIGFLREAHIRKSFDGLKKDFTRLSLASTLAEVVLRIAPPNAPCSELFKLLAHGLTAAEEAQIENWDVKILTVFIAKVLQWSGHQPVLESCLGCELPLEQIKHLPDWVTALVSEGGWLCPACKTASHRHLSESRRVHLRPSILWNLQSALRLPLRKAIEELPGARAELQELYAYLEGFLYFHIAGFDQGPIKSVEYLGLRR